MKKRSSLDIVGAGLVGSLLAATLAKRGYAIDLWERRSDLRTASGYSGRSINLAVSTRGLHALKTVGLDKKVLAQGIPMRGRMIHTPTNELKFQPYGRDDSQSIYSFSRSALNQVLLDCAEKSGEVRLHFDHKLTAVDLARSVLTFKDEKSGTSVNQFFAVAIGTDGSASVLRDAMAKTLGIVNSEVKLDYGYKELTIPAGAAGAFQMEKNALHIWPRGSFMLIALPNLDGSFTGTLFLPYEGPLSFASLNNQSNVADFFGTYFEDVIGLMPGYLSDYFANPTGHMSTVKFAPWNLSGTSTAMLLGDAAHGIVPFFGQGMNSGFEDISMLEEVLVESGDSPDWAKVFAELFQRRKVNTDAIADMAVENFFEMRDKVGDPNFLLERAVEKILENQFPNRYFSRYSLVTFSRVPYRQALEAGLVTEGILDELCASLATPNEVDLTRAEALIQLRLTPLLSRFGLGENDV